MPTTSEVTAEVSPGSLLSGTLPSRVQEEAAACVQRGGASLKRKRR
jgi:hypothetical protein